MKPAFLICIFPFIGLLSCVAPKAIPVGDENAAKPVPKIAAVPAVPEPTEPVADAPPAAPRKSWFSFLKKKDPPKAIVVELPRSAVKSSPKPDPVEDLPRNPSGNLSNNGLRLPDMLTMPEKGEFQSTAPTAPKTGGGTGAVIARPPTDPPSRPKTKEKTGEP